MAVYEGGHTIKILDMTSILGSGLMAAAAQHKVCRTARVSSWDQSGLNEDAFVVLPGQSITLADIEGPGTITHLWFVQTCRKILGPGLIPYSKSGVAMMEVHNALGLNYEISDPDYYRKVLIKMYWDNSETPSVIAPIGDFFCLGHSMAANFQSLPFTVSVKPSEERAFGGSAAFNCYLPMPFNSRARIEIENQNDEAYIQYFYIDYELYPEPHPTDKLLYFHASWNRSNPTPGWTTDPSVQTNSLETQIPNLDGADTTRNYTILEVDGAAGSYIGCNHSVTHFQGTWWGEGDDMIWVDDDFDATTDTATLSKLSRFQGSGKKLNAWPPSFHGTGGEDYFSQGWGMQKNAYPFCGTIIHEEDSPNKAYQVSYRWHLPDPVRFENKIKVTLEHGHANHLSDDWSTTAYWYQTLNKSGKGLTILPVDQRIPRKTEITPKAPEKSTVSEGQLSELQRKMLKQRQDRFDEFVADRNSWLERRAKDSKIRAENNVQIAKDIRSRWLASRSK
ncbi:hypothetical protein LTS08_001961 [Lithohypha guttulata]|nr:hypothetical protein LTS08_001961 [Lithohypha guttulata]